MTGRQAALCVASLLLALLGAAFSSRVLAAQGDRRPAVTDRDVTHLLAQIVAGLEAHNSRKMLSAFDLTKMKAGQLFRQDTESFFRQTGAIRAHYNILEISMGDGRGQADVAMEIEADGLDETLPPVHKQAQLHLLVENSPAGWKIVELEPRSFFSTQP
jgi:hypothetical protein